MSASDFISAYADYADIGELPRVFHELTGMFLLSAILNQKNITIPYGGASLSLDLWILLLSESGGGRGTALHTLNTIIETKEIVTGCAWGSGIAFKQKLAENLFAAELWGEFSEKMQAFNSAKMGDAKIFLTDCHDNFRIPKPITYRDTKKPNSDTPSIAFSGAPRTNFLATSSETWLLENVARGDVGGGWLPRWIILRSHAKRKDVSIPEVLDLNNRDRVADLLSRAERIQHGSKADIRGIEKLIDVWYTPAKDRFIAYDQTGQAFFNRHRTNIIKAAVVFEVSTSGTLNVSEASWNRAVRLMEDVEKTVAHLMKIGVSPRGNLLQQIEDAILAAGKEGISQNVITRQFQRVGGKELLEALGTLITGERVSMAKMETGGRKKTLFTHESFITGGQNGC